MLLRLWSEERFVLGVVHLLLGVCGFSHASLLHLHPKAVQFDPDWKLQRMSLNRILER
jgi:hypothetical protein